MLYLLFVKFLPMIADFRSQGRDARRPTRIIRSAAQRRRPADERKNLRPHGGI